MRENFRKGIYVLPTLFTCGNMSFGFLSMITSFNGYFTKAAWFLICAIACDMLDGRIARMTKTTSEFGVQMDSLSDLVSFGIAPAIMMYMLVLKYYGKVGIAIAILFVLCSALRLAKFNVMAQEGILHKTFIGLPTPASAGVIISFVLSYELLYPSSLTTLNFKTIPILMNSMPLFFKAMPVVIIILSFLMVSNVPYWSFKKIKLERPKAMRLMLMIIVMVLLILAFPQNIFFILFSVYALSGLLLYVSRILFRARLKKEDK
jgi:CDP-diacylglycerol--serine O-phosphatidyltransferase